LTSATIVAAVPSNFHSSRPASGVVAEKYRSPSNTVSSSGLELPLPKVWL
jgi:hypothetical protein